MASTQTRLGARLLMLSPVLILCIFALNQARLHASDNLSSWRGGGFGMFATVDRDMTRHFQATIKTRTGEVVDVQWNTVSRYFSADAGRAEALRDATALPSAHNLEHIATLLSKLNWKVENGQASAVQVSTGTVYPLASFRLSLYGVSYDKNTNLVTPTLFTEWRGKRA